MMNYKVQIDDDVIEGKAIDIVKYLRSKRFMGNDISLEELLLETCRNIFRLYGKSVVIDTTASLEMQCQQFIEQVLDHDLLKEIK